MGLADGMLVYGHARRTAAISLRDKGIKIAHNDDPNVGPTVDLSHLSAAERRAYVIADNQTALLAGWDDALLGLEVRELSAIGFDTTLLGFSTESLTELLIEAVGDDVAGRLLELADITLDEPRHQVAPNDHWLLSKRHHLLCVSVVEGWQSWRTLLKRGCLFIPYAGPFVPFGRPATEHALVMVQPDSYIAGHLLDRYADIRGEEALERLPV